MQKKRFIYFKTDNEYFIATKSWERFLVLSGSRADGSSERCRVWAAGAAATAIAHGPGLAVQMTGSLKHQ